MKAKVVAFSVLCLFGVGLETVNASAGSQPPVATVRVAGAPVGQAGGANTRKPKSGIDLTRGQATFVPPRPSFAVVVERQSADGWAQVAIGVQDAGGSFQFLADAGTVAQPFVFRARTIDSRGDTVMVSEPTPAEPPAMEWHDEFAGRALKSEWQHRPSPVPKRACSPVLAAHTTVAGGIAKLRHTAQSGPTATCPHGQNWAAMVGTDHTRQFLYGTFAARIKFHGPQGMHGAFWLQRAPVPGGPRPDDPAGSGSEIDVIEYFGTGASNGLRHTVWWDGPADPRTGQAANRWVVGQGAATAAALGSTKAHDGYHVYSVEWTPNEYVFRVDGQETMRTSEGVSRVPEYLILSLISSAWELPKNKDRAPGEMKVDWVRIWR